MSRRIIIDTDPGIDDAMAIYYALGAAELEVVALTTIFGNVLTPQATASALALLDIAGRPDIPVIEGAHGPLAGGVFEHPAAFVHGDDGLGDAGTEPSRRRAEAGDAARFIVEAARQAPGEITLVPLGPLTNVALARELEPELDSLLAGIVLMGGAAFVGGNVSPAAEANIFKDPEAADVVFGMSCPIVMAGLDVTATTVMGDADLARLCAQPGRRAAHLAEILPCYIAFHRRIGVDDGVFIHDPMTISYLLAPEAFDWVEHPVRVDTGNSFGRGATLACSRRVAPWPAWADRPPVRILTGVDATRVIDLQISLTAG